MLDMCTHYPLYIAITKIIVFEANLSNFQLLQTLVVLEVPACPTHQTNPKGLWNKLVC